jgi:hypothetical protein
VNGEEAATWDLGAAREVRGLLLQADADDRFPLSGSLDGQAFAPLGEIAALGTLWIATLISLAKLLAFGGILASFPAPRGPRQAS